MTINALVASDFALILLKPSSFAYGGLGIMLDFVRNVKTSLNGNLTILGIVLTFFDYDGGSLVAQDYKSLTEEITDKIGISPSEEA